MVNDINKIETKILIRGWFVLIGTSLFFMYNMMQMTLFNTLGVYFVSKFQIDSPVLLGFFSASYLLCLYDVFIYCRMADG